MPPRVIHIVEQLANGAVETWLIRMLRHARSLGVDVDWTFYCTLPEPGPKEPEALALAAKILRSPVPLSQNRAFFSALRRELHTGNYDVMHGHHDLMNGLYLAAAIGAPLRARLCQTHNADANVPTANPAKAALYRKFLRALCLRHADLRIGISPHALASLTATNQFDEARDRILSYGVDPAPFLSRLPDRAAFRASLQLPADARLLLFGGRVVAEKNPVFTVDVLAALRRRDPLAFAVFAGSGALVDAVRARARELGVEDAIRLLGWRDDLPAVMQACDWFILPRPEFPLEGFGLAVVEAQLAGLRLLLSLGVTEVPLLPTAIARRLPLSAGPDAWAAAAVELAAVDPAPAFAALDASPFQMDRALRALIALHQ